MTQQEKQKYVKSVLMPALREIFSYEFRCSGYSQGMICDKRGRIRRDFNERLWLCVNHYANQAYGMSVFPIRELGKVTVREVKKIARFCVRDFDKLMRAEFGADCLG